MPCHTWVRHLQMRSKNLLNRQESPFMYYTITRCTLCRVSNAKGPCEYTKKTTPWEWPTTEPWAWCLSSRVLTQDTCLLSHKILLPFLLQCFFIYRPWLPRFELDLSLKRGRIYYRQKFMAFWLVRPDWTTHHTQKGRHQVWWIPFMWLPMCLPFWGS